MDNKIITLQGLRHFALSFSGKTLTTLARKKPFEFSIARGGFQYLPKSSNLLRTQSNNDIEQMIKRFNSTRSLNPGNYQDISMNSSYLLTIISEYLEASDDM